MRWCKGHLGGICMPELRDEPLVRLKNGIESRRFAITVAQQPTQSITTVNPTIT
jgi:hypothetical protein